MRIDLDKLAKQLSSTEANERFAGIRTLQGDLPFGNPDLTPEIVQVLSKIATSDNNTIVRAEAKRLLERDEYLDLKKSWGIITPPTMPDESNEDHKQPTIPLTNVWKALAVLSILSFIALVWFAVGLRSNPIGEGYDAMLFYCFLLPWLIGTVAFWIFLYARWLAGWRKAVLILAAVISITPLAFIVGMYVAGIFYKMN